MQKSAIKKRSRKAQSDIVSYVLLIVIALGLAAGVYSFMKFYIPKDKETCSSDVSLYVDNYKCYVDAESRKILELNIKNKGLFNVTGFIIKGAENYSNLPIIMLKTIDFASAAVIPGRYDFKDQLKADNSITVKFDYTNNAQIQRIQVQPYAVSSQNKILLCDRIADIKLDGCDSSVSAGGTTTSACTPDCSDSSTHCIGVVYSKKNGCGTCTGTLQPDPSCANLICSGSCNDGCGNSYPAALICTFPTPVCNAAHTCQQESAINNLVAYYPFNGNANDIIGNHNGVVNGAVLTTGKIGQAYNFSGASDKIALSSLPVITTAGANTTISFWMYWTGTDSVMPIGWGTSGVVTSAYDLFLSGGFFGFNTGQANLVGIPSIGFINNWKYVTAVFYNGIPSNSKSSIYINGIQQTLATQIAGTGTSSRSVTTNAMVSGWPYSSQYNFTGKIDELRIYNRSLSASEVSELYALT